MNKPTFGDVIVAIAADAALSPSARLRQRIDWNTHWERSEYQRRERNRNNSKDALIQATKGKKK